MVVVAVVVVVVVTMAFSPSSSDFNVDDFETKLAALSPTEASIRSLAQWMLFHSDHAKAMVSTWNAEFMAAPANRKATFLHLVNEILQSRSGNKPPFEVRSGQQQQQ